ncbi:hypothetical protein ACJDU8_21790 [Clostridium sp. WILCCON 0269]|uniref:Uncharacterized protein n=1 Tax=Candidatus Clostridium eludens TaxID=3381663 RepID=A0ABW8SSL3_9CLOT
MLKMKYKLLSALVIAAPLLLNTGIATTVHASSIDRHQQLESSKVLYNRAGAHDSYYSLKNFSSKLDALVSAGTITESQETILLNLFYGDQLTSENFKSQLDVLVTAGTITQSQEYSILNVFTNWTSNWEIPSALLTQPAQSMPPVQSTSSTTTSS